MVPSVTSMQEQDQVAIEIPTLSAETSEMPNSHLDAMTSPKAFSSYGLTDLTVFIPGSVRSKDRLAFSPPRWKTPEFILYWIILLIAVPQMALAVMRISQRK